MIDALVYYVVNRYPDLVGLYRIFEPMVASLMLGVDCVCQADQMNHFLKALMERDLHTQCKLEIWQILDINSLSSSAGAHLISIQKTRAGRFP
jgi:hypothetical protein